MWIRRLAAISVALGVGGCLGGGANSPGGGDPERMSEAEYDIARDTFLRQKNPRKALEHALKAVDLHADNHEASHLVALIYLALCSTPKDECRLPDAEKYARASIQAKEDFREAKNTLGVVLIHSKKYDEAIAVLRPLSEDMLYQTPENAWGNLGWAYLEKGKLDAAIDALSRSVAAQPLFCVGNFRLGVAHEKKKQLTEAVEAYGRALETESPACKGLQDAYLGRGRVLVKLGRGADAAPDLRKCKELMPTSPAGKECSSILANLK
ncbi:MAG: tetratricopeptide repeat protein [Polyangiaceae bacterium]|nr:tetratricopeptide repeat protein [Polyangiaceae bacterium]